MGLAFKGFFETRTILLRGETTMYPSKQKIHCLLGLEGTKVLRIRCMGREREETLNLYIYIRINVYIYAYIGLLDMKDITPITEN